MNNHGGTCCLCYGKYEDWGHNPEPLGFYKEGRCCTKCNNERVIPARIQQIVRNHPSNGKNT